MSSESEVSDEFVAANRITVVERGPAVVAEQPADAELENHVGVRHASALHAAGYEASRALVVAALEDLGPLRLSLVESEIAYKAMGQGTLRSVAEPCGDAWAGAAGRLRAARPVELVCAVTTRNGEDRVVAELTLRWAVSLSA